VRRGDEAVEKVALPLSQLAPSHSPMKAFSGGVRGKAGISSAEDMGGKLS